ncbi:MAG: FKBP-type peptidyl-prolyl cis-trans isomerase [Bacteroidota bacterium]
MRLRLAVATLVLPVLFFTACDSNDQFDEQPMPREVADEDYTVTDSGLKYFDFDQGAGPEAAEGDSLLVLYNGWLTNGLLFDSSLFTGRPFPVILGQGRVIAGWEEGLLGMRENGTRQIVIPPDLAYGDQGSGATIPPGATLIFEVAVVELRDASD